jgi:hypothetical protein
MARIMPVSPDNARLEQRDGCTQMVGDLAVQPAVAGPELWVRPLFHGYHPGQYLETPVFGLDGSRLGVECLRVDFSPGSGFAGQVLRAEPLRGVAWGRTGPGPHPAVALKILRPRSSLKTAFRDGLFRLAYQTSYAARLEETALRAGLIWQEILRQAVLVELGEWLSVARPLGYYWDASVGSYVEIHQWVEARAAAYQVDDGLLQYDRSPQAVNNPSEMARKRLAMEQLVELCHRIGAHGLARQYEWYTFVSQANVLTLSDSSVEAPKFVVVDCRPGLAVPFFLPLSPAHARIIVKGLRRGFLVHFDQCDLSRLDAWLGAHSDLAKGLRFLVEKLRADDIHYREGLPDLWQRRLNFWMDAGRRKKVCLARLQAWQRCGSLSPRAVMRLKISERLFWLASCLDNFPLLGPWLLRWLGNSAYRRHLSALVRNPSYRSKAIGARRQVDLEDWQTVGRIPAGRANRLAGSLPRYLVEKYTLGWLPVRLHRLLVDSQARQHFIQERLALPLDLCFREKKRRDWLCTVIVQQRERGLVSRAKADELCAQAAEARLQGFVRDLGFSLALEIFSKLTYLALAVYGLSSGDFWLLGLALFGPIPPSGAARVLYNLSRLGWELPGIFRRRDRRGLTALCLGIAVAPWRLIGNLFAPLEMLFYYRRLSLLLADHFVSQMVRGVPVFGGEGELLEYWAFQATFNLPLSVYRRLVKKWEEPDLSGAD